MTRSAWAKKVAYMIAFGRSFASSGPAHVTRPHGPAQRSGSSRVLWRNLTAASGGGGSGGASGSKGGGGGGGGKGGAGPYALWLAYLKLLEAYPMATRVATSAALNGVGDVLGQTLFEKDKPFDWIRFGKFVFLGGALVAPVLNLWYGTLNRLVPAQTTAGAIGRLLLDQGVFAPVFCCMFISSLMLLDGAPHLIIPKLRQDIAATVLMNWKIWIPAQFVNFRFVRPDLNLLFSNFVALIWSTYLSWAATRAVAPAKTSPAGAKKR